MIPVITLVVGFLVGAVVAYFFASGGSDDSATELASLNEKYNQAVREKTDAAKRAKDAEASLTEAKNRGSAASAAIAELEAERDAAISGRLEAIDQATKANERADAMIEERDELKANVGKLEANLKDSTRALIACQTAREDLQKSVTSDQNEQITILQDDLERTQRELRVMRAKIEKDRAKMATLTDELERNLTKLDGVRAELSAANDTISSLQSAAPSNPAPERVAVEPAPLERPASFFDTTPEAVDDLKKIKGIGKVYEGLLNKMGIYQFQQIAALRDQDIEYVAEQLNTSAERIRGGEWVAQAASFAK